MTELVLFLLLSAIAVLLLALPFFRRQEAVGRESFDLSVHRDQLAELERDLERGIIDEEAARGARLEIERRILAAAGDENAPLASPGDRSIAQIAVAAVLVAAVPIGSALLYLQTGKPEMRDMPLAARPAPEQQLDGRDSLLANIEELERHLESTPDNGGVWIVLGRTRMRAGLYQEAVAAFQKGAELVENDPTVHAELGEAMVYAAGGQVTPASLEKFRATLETVPNEPRARYYLGMALAQEGDIDGALDGWRQLLEVSPSDAPWRPQIVEAVRSALQASGRPADEIVAGLPEGTAPTGGAAAPAATPANAGGDAASRAAEDEQIRGMVEGLAARLENEPDDLEGWLMLGRSRLVLQEPDLARQAFARAKELAPDDPAVLLGYAASLLEPSQIEGADPNVGAEAEEVYQELVTLVPDDPEPRWMLGLAAAQTGEVEAAVGHWRDFLGLIGDDSEDRTIVEARIEALENGDPAAALAAGAPTLAPTAASRSPTENGATAAADANPSQARPGSGPGPTEEDRAAMAALSPEERQDRIRGMVESLAARLEDDPSDVEGWLRLAQSRTVLGEPEAAEEAYRRAMEQAPENVEVLRAYAGSLLGGPHPETSSAEVGAEAEDLYRKIVEIAPDDPEAHWYLGLAAVQDGTMDEAKTHWQRVLDLLGPDHPNYAAVQSSLEQVQTRTQ